MSTTQRASHMSSTGPDPLLKDSVLTNHGFEQLPEEDSLMQELLELQNHHESTANAK